jgi:hypothetical protein
VEAAPRLASSKMEIVSLYSEEHLNSVAVGAQPLWIYSRQAVKTKWCL